MAGRQVQELSGDLVPFIPNPGLSFLTAKVERTQWAQAREVRSSYELGTVTLSVLRLLHGDSVKVGGTIQVPAERVADRIARFKHNFNQWNNLPLANGNLLIVVIGNGNGTDIALAAIQIASPDAPEVAAVTQCFDIEDGTEPPEKVSKMLQHALGSDQRILRYYALDYLGRRAKLDKQHAVELISRVISSSDAAPVHKLELGVRLTDLVFFAPYRKAEPSNQVVVSALAQGFVRESDRDRRATWMRLLASTVLPEFSPKAEEDNEIRTALVRSVRVPSKEQVVSALTDVQSSLPPDEAKIAWRLLELWRSN